MASSLSGSLAKTHCSRRAYIRAARTEERFDGQNARSDPSRADGERSQSIVPGTRDVLVLEEGTDDVGKSGGIKHFGFRLTDARDIDKAANAIEKAGGTIKHRGEFVPGEPYVFFSDPDGYEVEVWYELPTDTVP